MQIYYNLEQNKYNFITCFLAENGCFFQSGRNNFSNELHTAVSIPFSVPSLVQSKITNTALIYSLTKPHSAKIICKPYSVFELDLLITYHIHKNHNKFVNCDFAILPSSDCWKSFIRFNFPHSSFTKF